MEPLSMSLGVIAARVMVKAQERLADQVVDSGEGLVSGFVAWLQARFSNDEAASHALRRVSDGHSGSDDVDAVAAILDGRASEDADFRALLAMWVEEAHRDPLVGSFVTEVYDDAEVGKIVNIGQARDVSL